MRALVCGSRDYTDREHIYRELSRFSISTVIEGEARGVDTIAREWAEEMNLPVLRFPADWKQYGRAAGPIRNKEMLTEGKPHIVIAFLAEGSKGTANMIRMAEIAGVPVNVIRI
jgi:hypothetical protein